MKERIMNRFAWLHVFSAIDVDALADSVIEEFEKVAKEHPNDADFGAEMRKLIGK